MSKRSFRGVAGRELRMGCLALVAVVLTACGAPGERRIDDPDCEHCYKLESGVTYKTFEYYDP